MGYYCYRELSKRQDLISIFLYLGFLHLINLTQQISILRSVLIEMKDENGDKETMAKTKFTRKKTEILTKGHVSKLH
jgi:hypothetical protein